MELEGLRTSRFGGLHAFKKKRSSTLRRPWSEINRNVRAFNDSDGGHNKLASNDYHVKLCNESVIALFAPTNKLANLNTEKDSLHKEPRDQNDSVGKICNKSIKVKLKLGGVKPTIHEKSYRIRSSSSAVSLQPSNSSQNQRRLITQKNAVEIFSMQENSQVFKRDSLNDINGLNSFYKAKEDPLGKENITGEAASYRSFPVGKTVPRRWMSGTVLSDSDEDDEICFLERLRASKAATGCTSKVQDNKIDGSDNREICGGFKRSTAHMDDYYVMPSGWTTKQRKRSIFEREPSDADYVAQEMNSSISAYGPNNAKQKKLVDLSTEGRLEPHITRQRALQSGNGTATKSLIEFPNGLPLAPSKTKAAILSEEETRAKKVEAAQRRKIQSERTARESEAKTIRKIRGLDSDQRKADKERERAHKAKAAISGAVLSNSVRLVMGPNGTVLTFPKGVPLPNVFNSKPCSYPPPREKCAGPSCTNSYKYRDSRSNLPLCSLLCYRAVQGSGRSVNSRTC